MLSFRAAGDDESVREQLHGTALPAGAVQDSGP
jgi:hypothetical protein